MLYGVRLVYRINQSHSLPHNTERSISTFATHRHTERSIFTLATHRLSKSHCSPALHSHHPSALHAAESAKRPVNPKNICSMASSFVNSKKTKTLKTT